MMSFKERFWIKWYELRPHVVMAGAYFLWLVAASPMLLGAFLFGWSLVDLAWWKMLFSAILWGTGLFLMAPVDDWARQQRHQYKHRHWQGDIPEWRP
jgi:hypothetical protein